MRELIAACLAKDPAARPGPAAVTGSLAGPVGAAGLTGPGWLPAPVVEGVSRRAVRLLDLEPDAPDGPSAEAPTADAPAPDGRAAAERALGPTGPVHDGRTDPDGAAAPRPPGGRGGRRVLLAVGAAVVAAALAVGGYLVLRTGDDPPPGASGGTVSGPDGGGPEGGDGGSPSRAHRMPEEYLGTWRGELTMLGGLPAGEMVVTLEDGAIGEEVGSALHTPPIAVSQCVDVLRLAHFDGDDMVFDAEVDQERSTPGTCAQGEFQVVLTRSGPDTLGFRSTHPDSGHEGLLERDG